MVFHIIGKKKINFWSSTICTDLSIDSNVIIKKIESKNKSNSIPLPEILPAETKATNTTCTLKTKCNEVIYSIHHSNESNLLSEVNEIDSIDHMEINGDIHLQAFTRKSNMANCTLSKSKFHGNSLQLTPKSKKIKMLQLKLDKIRKTIKYASKRSNKSEFLKKLQNTLTATAYQFILSQIAASSRYPRGRRWSLKDKSFYLDIYFQSPATYRMLSKMMPLPSKNTLLQSITGFVNYPGFCYKLLSTLKKVTKSMSDLDKFCVLIFDEMSIKSSLHYNAKTDTIMGFLNYGGKNLTNKNVLATHALVFMIRGLCKQWKQPFGYFLTGNSIPSSDFKCLLLEAIDLVTNAGFKIVCLICDQSPINQGL